MPTVHYVKDLLANDVERYDVECGKRVIQCKPSGFRLGPYALVHLNGRALRGSDLYEMSVTEDDQVVFAQLPGVFPFALGAGLAAGAGAASAGITLGGILSFLGTVALNAAIGFTFTGIAGVLQGEKRVFRSIGTFRNQAEFRGRQPTVGEGVEVPYVYGDVESFAHIVESFESSRFEEETGDPVEVTDGPGGTVLFFTQNERIVPTQPALSTRMVTSIGPVESVNVLSIDDRDVDQIPGLQLYTRSGVPNQKNIPGFQKQVITKVVNTPVTNAGGAVTVTTDVEVDDIELVIVLPNGFNFVSDGNFFISNGVQLKFETRRFNDIGGFTDHGTKTIFDLTFTRREFRVHLPVDDRAIYDVRVTRVSADATPPVVADTEIGDLDQVTIEDRMHPGLAQVGALQLSREHQIESAPAQYRIAQQGFNDIRVYTSPTTFTTKFTRNPAWCCAHFLQHKRIGLGRFFAYDDIDIPSFLDWAEHCDELVDDGQGGTAPRCQFDYEFRVEESMQSVLERFTAGADAFLLLIDGKWQAILDRKQSKVVQVFHPGNIVNGQYDQRWIPPAQRPPNVRATFQDRTKDFAEDFLVAESPDQDALTPVTGRTFDMRHITREFQVARQLEKMRLRNIHQKKEVTLTSSFPAMHVLPGDLIGVAVPVSKEVVRSGQIISANTANTIIQVDGSVTVETGKSYEMTVIHKLDNVAETRTVANSPENDVSHIQVSAAFQRSVVPGDGFSFAEVDRTVERYQVLETRMGPDFLKQITAIQYSDLVHSDALPFDIDAPAPLPISKITDVPPVATDLVVGTRQPKDSAGNTIEVVDVDWNAPISMQIREFHVLVREKNNAPDYVLAGITTGRRLEIKRNFFEPAQTKTYEILVQTIGILGNATALDQSPRAEIVI